LSGIDWSSDFLAIFDLATLVLGLSLGTVSFIYGLTTSLVSQLQFHGQRKE
jgi:hypothetical protein